MVLGLLTFLNYYMYTLRLIHYVLLLTQSSSTNARLVAFALSFALDPTFVPQDFRHCSTLSYFKARLKTFLFSQYFLPN